MRNANQCDFTSSRVAMTKKTDKNMNVENVAKLQPSYIADDNCEMMQLLEKHLGCSSKC